MQQGLLPQQWRTHISTVLRYPPPPEDPTASDGRVRLAVRLDAGVAERAGAFALRLPGQPSKRGPRDYSPRPLSDALVTAIALAKPFVDEGLDNLPPLLTHDIALSLWRLTVAATLMPAEQHALYAADEERDVAPAQASQLGDVLRTKDVSWHSPWRFEVALHLARRLLIGPDRNTNWEMLRDRGESFDLLVSDLELTDDFDHELLFGAPRQRCNMDERGQFEGRGGAAVWRAQRSIALKHLEQWIVSPDPSPAFIVEPPGWRLAPPSRWHALFYPTGQPHLRPQLDHLAMNRVLCIQGDAGCVLWPYDETGTPIKGFDAVIAGAGDVSATQLVELALASSEDGLTSPQVPVELAHSWGFVSDGERDALVARAAAGRRSVLQSARDDHRLTPEDRTELGNLIDAPELFARLARKLKLYGRAGTVATWTWTVGSVAEQVESGASDSQLRWLAEAMRGIRQRALERDMERAWNRAFWLGRAAPDTYM